MQGESGGDIEEHRILQVHNKYQCSFPSPFGVTKKPLFTNTHILLLLNIQNLWKEEQGKKHIAYTTLT